MLQEFSDDCAQLLSERLKAGRIDRRQMLLGMTALGMMPGMLGSDRAHAAVPDMMMATSGGDSEKAIKQTYIAAYEKKTGGKMTTDSSFPSAAKMKAMVESGNVYWDLCDSGVSAMGLLGPLGMLVPIDYSVVDRSQVTPEFTYEYGVCNYMSSHVMAWDTKAVQGTPTLADFFDLKKIPGKRSIRKSATAMMEMALMADGVPADKLYPLDRPRALKKLASIKDQVLWWSTGAESIDRLRNGEVVMGWMWHTRANVLKSEGKGRFDYTFRGGFLMPSLWLVPKGSKAAQQAMVAIAAMQDPQAQIELLRLLGNGPSNPKASAMMPPELRAIDNGSPENAAVQAKVDAKYYGQFNAETEGMFLDMIAS